MGTHNKFVAKIKKRGDATLQYKENPDSDKLVQHFALKSDNFEDRRVFLII